MIMVIPPPRSTELNVSASRCAIYSFDLAKSTLVDPRDVWSQKAKLTCDEHDSTRSSPRRGAARPDTPVKRCHGALNRYRKRE